MTLEMFHNSPRYFSHELCSSVVPAVGNTRHRINDTKNANVNPSTRPYWHCRIKSRRAARLAEGLRREPGVGHQIRYEGERKLCWVVASLKLSWVNCAQCVFANA